MLKKATLAVAIIVMFIQLIVPVGMITYSEITDMNMDRYGTEYKFRIKPTFVTEYEIGYSVDTTVNFYDGYGILKTNPDGFSEIYTDSDEKPDETAFISGKNDTYYLLTNNSYVLETPMSESKAMYLNDYYSDYEVRYDYTSENPFKPYVEAYLTAVIYKGHVKITSIVIDGETYI